MGRFLSVSVAAGIAAAALASSASAQSPSALPAVQMPDAKIGLVTDVGSLDDKSFNQYSWAGTQDGAARVGAAAPQSAQSAVSADIKKNIQAFVDQGYDIIVTVGFAAGNDTAAAAKANPDIHFIGVDQSFICLDDNGDVSKDDPATKDVNEAKCTGDPAKLLPNYVGIGWHEEQPGYLAGIVAASISKTAHIAAIGGTETIPAVVNYIEGYKSGAHSVNPDTNVTVYYVSRQPDNVAFNSPDIGTSIANQLLSQFPDIDVMFQVAGNTGNGVLEAACDAGIWGIGVDVDEYISLPKTAPCTFVSAEKKLKKNVSDMIVRIADGTAPAGGVKLGIDTGDVGLSPFHEFQSQVTPELQAALDAATAGLKDGSITPCQLNDFGGCVNTEAAP
jgi:basic membrane protein A